MRSLAVIWICSLTVSAAHAQAPLPLVEGLRCVTEPQPGFSFTIKNVHSVPLVAWVAEERTTDPWAYRSIRAGDRLLAPDLRIRPGEAVDEFVSSPCDQHADRTAEVAGAVYADGSIAGSEDLVKKFVFDKRLRESMGLKELATLLRSTGLLATTRSSTADIRRMLDGIQGPRTDDSVKAMVIMLLRNKNLIAGDAQVVGSPDLAGRMLRELDAVANTLAQSVPKEGGR